MYVYVCVLVKKNGERNGRSDLVTCDVLCVLCVVLRSELLPMQSVFSIVKALDVAETIDQH